MIRRCLYCYDEADNTLEYHLKCTRKFFGRDVPPALQISDTDLEKLALINIGRNPSHNNIYPVVPLKLKANRPAEERALLEFGGSLTDFVLRPPYNGNIELPAIQDLTMKMAEASGIKTTPHSLIRMCTGGLAYISRVFNRQKKEVLHSEDFAQILGYQTEKKYSASLEAVGKGILKYSTFPGNDAINFFERIIFCFLTGNSDMHLKKFSLLKDQSGCMVLSPAYDLYSSTLLQPQETEESALSLNNKRSGLTKNDFSGLALDLKINEKTLRTIYKRFSDLWDGWNMLIGKSFLSDEKKDAFRFLINRRYVRLRL